MNIEIKELLKVRGFSGQHQLGIYYRSQPLRLLFVEKLSCESLERLDLSFRNPDIRLNFRNCFKLNEEARDLIIHTPTNQYAVFPAEEVPMCFTYRSSGSSLTLKLNQMPLGKSTKFKACIIFARISPGHLYTFEVEVETEDVTSTELVFEFEYELESYNSRRWKIVIKECGILPLLEPSDKEI
ncbi:hypothetical protein F2Q69_00008640 [Brassica cretica]|uniref:C-JID domain-containing protein n=1 Tax=Brassica cretica TaxID=69181 RepID=A0A8S9P3W7_BRACR|nr:hypothetical protein F2Q69_00008640 [Brassica cretica]